MSRPHAPTDRPRLGISACLLGETVRYDGTHRRARFCADTMAHHVEWVPVCPEVELGLGVPRPTIRLEQAGRGVRLREPAGDRDLTVAMDRWAGRRVRALADADLDGFVLKARSPSCGPRGVKVHRRGAPVRRSGQGRFAAALAGLRPELPTVDEAALDDPRRRGAFVAAVFGHRRLKELFRGAWTVSQLAEFHARHALQLRAHDVAGCRALDRLLARTGGRARAQLREGYTAGFLAVLGRPTAPSRHADVLRHLVHRLRPDLRPTVHRSLRAAVDRFRAGRTSLATVRGRVRTQATRARRADLLGQTYLSPSAAERALRPDR